MRAASNFGESVDVGHGAMPIDCSRKSLGSANLHFALLLAQPPGTSTLSLELLLPEPLSALCHLSKQRKCAVVFELESPLPLICSV
jgi:hypothetical protein